MDEQLQTIINIWQPASSRPLGRGDAQEIVSNLAGFFKVLREWDEQDALVVLPCKVSL